MSNNVNRTTIKSLDLYDHSRREIIALTYLSTNTENVCNISKFEIVRNKVRN